MKPTVLPSLTFTILLLAGGVVTARAQTSPTTAPVGLDALHEQRVLGQLADLGLGSLLDREFTLAHTPPAQQSAMLALLSMRKLTDPATPLTAAQRQQLSDQIIHDVDAALPGLHDPALLMQIAGQMATACVEPDINILQYWGENTATQNRVRPAVQAVLKIYQQAAQLAAQQADAIANRLTPNDDAGAKLWQQTDTLRDTAVFRGLMADYDLCLVLPPDEDQRSRVADQAIAGLKPYDTHDSGVQAAVRNRIAQLQLAKGNYAAAMNSFSAVIDNPGNEIQPPPNKAEQYNARYFSAVAQIQAGNLDDASQSIDALEPWQRRNLDAAQQPGAAAAYAMLEYRLHSKQADLASDPAEKKKADDAAVAVLLQLLHDQPQYKGVVFEQLAARISTQQTASSDLTTMDPLLLLALQQKGEQQCQLPPDQKADPKILTRAIAAAREIIKRSGQNGIDEQTAARSAFVIPYLLQRLGQSQAAAAAFLDYAQQHPQPLPDANIALDHATALIGQLRKEDPQNQQTRKLYDRFLPLAIAPPFDRKQFAFEYALLLQREGHYRQALDYFQQVPADDPRQASVPFYRMVALKQQLDDPANSLSPTERANTLMEVQTLADQINAQTSDDLAKATTPEQKQRDQSRLVRTALIAAGTASQEQKDYHRTLALLSGFEQKVAGLPNAAGLLSEALALRVNAYMALGQTTDATGALVQMLKANPGNEGPALVFDLLKQLDAGMNRAQAAGDLPLARQLAQNRATLSGFLVSWAASNSDPKVKALTPKYQIFDATTKQQAAELASDPAIRKADLQAALKQYQALNNPAHPDPSVQLGMGFVQYDLGHYAAAAQALGPLVVNKQVGTPTMTVQQNGQPTQVDNPQYWEAVLKLLRSIDLVARQNPRDAQASANLKDAKNYLKQLYVQWPRTIGGTQYHRDFEQLRAQLIPDFSVAAGA